MSQFYSDPARESEEHALPDAEVFELTAREVAEMDEDEIFEFSRRPEFRLATMNSHVRDAMFDAIIEECAIEGGWFYWFCMPGCMPDSAPFGPFDTREEAIESCRDEFGEGADK